MVPYNIPGSGLNRLLACTAAAEFCLSGLWLEGVLLLLWFLTRTPVVSYCPRLLPRAGNWYGYPIVLP
jgi:hypothetical protein